MKNITVKDILPIVKINTDINIYDIDTGKTILKSVYPHNKIKYDKNILNKSVTDIMYDMIDGTNITALQISITKYR